MDLMGVYRVITACLFLLTCQLCAGVQVGKVEMDSAHRFLQGDDAILPCRFYGQPIAVDWDMEGKELFIAWIENRDPSPTKNGRLEILDDFSLAIKNVTTSDAGKYICKVSDYRGHFIWNKTDLQVAVPPMKPFPLIELCSPPGLNDSSQCQLRVDNSSTVELSCVANGASAGLTTLYWMHNDSVISSDMTISSNADGTENVTSTITAHPSNIPYICVATLNATKVVTSTTSVIIKPYHESKASPDVTSTTPPATNHPDETGDNIKPADNHSRNTIAAVAVPVSILLLLAIIAIAFALVCVKKKLPIRSPWLYKTCQMEESRQGNPDARSDLCVTYVASTGKASIIPMTPKSNDLE